MKKKFLCLALALAMLMGLVACGGNNTEPPADEPQDNPPPVENNEPSEPETPAYLSASHDDTEIYNMVMGEFYDALQTAKKAGSISERYALMAIAEAKLLETGTMVPNESNGGNYAIARIVPRSSSTVMWGSDSDRFETTIVANDFLKSEDRTALVNAWKEQSGQGTYAQFAKDYLTEHGYTIQDTYTFYYTQDPTTWDSLATFQSVNSEASCMTVDNLVQYDMENVQQPALAESWEVSEDGLTYTFHIREGVVWTDSQGRKVADLTADDFVAGMQHLMDVKGGAQELIRGVIKGAGDYIDGNTVDIADVGVKAVDTYTLEYTLEAPAPYFMSMLTYVGAFSPLCRSYYESQGGVFGQEAYAAASAGTDYKYGTSPDTIAYCGPYLVTNWTEKNTIVYQLSPTYWNTDNVNIKTLTMLFNAGDDVMKGYNDAIAGVVAGTGLNASSLVQCKQDGMFDDYNYLSAADGSSFMGWYNINRQSWANYNDQTKCVSPQTEDDAARTHAAMLNQNFRLALCFALDRGSYRAQSVGEDLKYASMRNSLVPGTFVQLPEEVTVSINGTSTTFPAGTQYGAMVQAQLDADGFPIKVFDPDADDGYGSGDNFDGWFNVDNAKAYMKKAVEELAAEGLEITAENPIQIDVTYFKNSELWQNRMNVYKQCLEGNLDGLVQVNLIGAESAEDWYYSGYLVNVGADMNFNVSFTSGWSADYADPANYLDTMQPDGNGYMCINLGLWYA